MTTPSIISDILVTGMGDPGDQTLQIILEAWKFFQEIQTDVATSCELTECELSAPSRHCNSFHTGHNGATPTIKVLDMTGNILCLCFVMGISFLSI